MRPGWCSMPHLDSPGSRPNSSPLLTVELTGSTLPGVADTVGGDTRSQAIVVLAAKGVLREHSSLEIEEGFGQDAARTGSDRSNTSQGHFTPGEGRIQRIC